MKKLLVLDGNSILNRAFYGIKLLTTKTGDYTNGIYGFLTMLNKLLEETSPDGVAIAFDRKGPTFRHQAYEGYKSNSRNCWGIWGFRSSPARAGRPMTSWAPSPPSAKRRESPV